MAFIFSDYKNTREEEIEEIRLLLEQTFCKNTREEEIEETRLLLEQTPCEGTLYLGHYFRISDLYNEVEVK